MKRSAAFLFVLLFAFFFLTACGSNTKPDPVDTTGSPYTFINASTPMDIDESDTDYELFIQLLKDGFGMEGQLVKIAPFDIHYGYIRPSSIYTDEDGWAIYSYHSPADTSKLAGEHVMLDVIYDDENGSVLYGNIELIFVAPGQKKPDGGNCDGEENDGNTNCTQGG